MVDRVLVAAIVGSVGALTPSVRPHEGERIGAPISIMSRTHSFAGLSTRSLVCEGVAALVAAYCLGCEHPVPTVARGGTVVAVAVVPPTVTVDPGVSEAFAASGVTNGGDTIPGAPVVWSATGGSITQEGVFTAGTQPGTFSVIANALTQNAQSGRASVTVIGRKIAMVSVQPDTATLPIQGSWRLQATPFDSAGDSIPGTPIVWTTSAPGTAVVDANGVVTAVAPGTATITAAALGLFGTAVVTVVPPGSGPWPHEPAGFQVISDQPWDALTSLGWIMEFGAGTIGVDLNAPLSPPNVLQVTYPVGFGGGDAPVTMTHDLGGVRQLYAGMWWKPSNPWQGHPSNVNKIAFAFPSSGGDIYLAMYGPPGGPFELRVLPQFPGLPINWLVPNVNHTLVQLGTWHRIEWLMSYSTTTNPANGIVRWWLDGQLLGDYFDQPFPSGALGAFKLSPTWGGIGSTKTELDMFWYDHVHVSGR